MFDYTSSDVNAYVKDKIKMLSEFGVIIKDHDKLKDELLSLNSFADIDRRCRTIIRDHLDKLNENDLTIKKSKETVRNKSHQ